LGSLPLDQIVAPAIQLCRDGVEVNQTAAEGFALLRGVFCLEPDGQRLYTKKNKPLLKGDRVHNEDHAQFLQTLCDSNGETHFYSGGLADSFIRDLHEESLLTRQDLDHYQVIEREPFTYTYRGKTIHSNPLPSWGGVLIKTSLQLFERFTKNELGVWGSPEHLVALASVMEQFHLFVSLI